MKSGIKKPLSLAVRLPLLGCIRDLLPVEYAHAGRINKNNFYFTDKIEIVFMGKSFIEIGKHKDEDL